MLRQALLLRQDFSGSRWMRSDGLGLECDTHSSVLLIQLYLYGSFIWFILYIYLLQTVIWHSYTLNYQRAKPFGIARVVLNCKAISIPKPEIDPLMEIYPMDPGIFFTDWVTGSHGPLGRPMVISMAINHRRDRWDPLFWIGDFFWSQKTPRSSALSPTGEPMSSLYSLWHSVYSSLFSSWILWMNQITGSPTLENVYTCLYHDEYCSRATMAPVSYQPSNLCMLCHRQCPRKT